ncbi:hypothetical protein, partial [Streptomyces lasiicapitis]|uniref:hypothetical protein n=1 Tax=Streptomyces lasiicapitis TaxID=1923961 RepID=UPI003684325F
MPHDLGAGMLVAKDHEQKQITGAVLAKRGAAVIGPAGVGKTALLSAVTRLLDPARFEVVWTAATEAGSRIPFGVFRGLCCVEAPLDHGRTYGLGTGLQGGPARHPPPALLHERGGGMSRARPHGNAGGG